MGTEAMQDELPKNVGEYFHLGAEKFASFLVGKTLELNDPTLEDEPCKGRVTGIVHQYENAVEGDPSQATPSDWQVSVMSSENLREYTYSVVEFTNSEGAVYLALQNDLENPPNVKMTILDAEDKREEAKKLFKEKHFAGGCADGQDIIHKKGLSKIKNRRIAVWWPAERAWYEAQVSATFAPDKMEVTYFDGTPKDTTQFTELEGTQDTVENGRRAQQKRVEIISDVGAKAATKKNSASGNSKKRKAPGKAEYKADGETILMNDGNLTLKLNSENMMRLVDTSLPRMKRKTKFCHVSTPAPECAIFTIQETSKNPTKHIVNVVSTKHSLHSADMSLQDEKWNLDWCLESKKN